MKKSKRNIFLISILVICTIAGCGNPTDKKAGVKTDVNPEKSKDVVYVNVQVQLPTANINADNENNKTDSDGSTSNTATKEHENRVNSVLLVLADKDDKFIACGEQASLTALNKAKGTIGTVQKIDKAALATYYKEDGTLDEGKDRIHIYAFCNPTNELKDLFKEHFMLKEWIHKTENITEDANGNIIRGETVWGGKDHQHGFLMSTADRASIEKSIPQKMEHWEKHTQKDTPFNFSGTNRQDPTQKEINNEGNIRVERAVARIDFKDGSKNGDQTYLLGNDKGNATLKVKLTKMALVNMSRDFYYLRRVSDDGTNADALICGTEYSHGPQTNYVVDTDAAIKNGVTRNIDKGYPFKDYFNFCLGNYEGGNWHIDATARSQWYTSLISKVIKNNGKGYHTWRYVTENTIPGIEMQQNGITTGIVLKGQIMATDKASRKLQDAIANAKGDPAKDPILYSYANTLYVTWEEVREKAFLAEESGRFYKAVFGNTPKNRLAIKSNGQAAVYSADKTSPDYLWQKWHEQNIDNKAFQADFRKAAKKAQFTLYQSSTDDYDAAGYYCYYFCWSRHNDNQDNNVMGPMEFAIVRNHIYKLSVTGINRLGHPRISENDPTPITPDTPDEKDSHYLTLSVEVAPWRGALTTWNPN
ncbi:MAG: hypothetical protein EP145_06150 [Bacteroides uniformis]|nr:hypothetical protein [Bacteroides uniformis]